jgi:hypothetical protein
MFAAIADCPDLTIAMSVSPCCGLKLNGCDALPNRAANASAQHAAYATAAATLTEDSDVTNPKRYDPNVEGDMEESPDGAYVRWEDYDALQAQLTIVEHERQWAQDRAMRAAHEPRAPLRAPETAAEVILGGNWIVGYCASCTPVDGMHQPDCPILADMRAALNRGEKHV